MKRQQRLEQLMDKCGGRVNELLGSGEEWGSAALAAEVDLLRWRQEPHLTLWMVVEPAEESW